MMGYNTKGYRVLSELCYLFIALIRRFTCEILLQKNLGFEQSEWTQTKNISQVKSKVSNDISLVRLLFTVISVRNFRSVRNNYRLTHSASEISGFTCTSSLTMNEKLQYSIENLHHDNDVTEVVSSYPSITWYKSANEKIGIRTVYET